MASILKIAVPDLTRIAKRNGGVFPPTRVQNIIAGTESSGLGHGSRKMPVRGPLFSEITDDRDYGRFASTMWRSISRAFRSNSLLDAKYRARGLMDGGRMYPSLAAQLDRCATLAQ